MAQNTDKFQVKGFKSWLITKTIGYLEDQIEDKDLEEILLEVANYFPRKHEKEVYATIRNLLGRSYLIVLRLEKHGEKKAEVAGENKCPIVIDTKGRSTRKKRRGQCGN